MTALPSKQRRQDRRRYEQHRIVVLAAVLYAVAAVSVVGIVLFVMLAGAENVEAWPGIYAAAFPIPLVAFYGLLRAMNSRQLGWDARIELSKKASLRTEVDVLKTSLSMMGFILTGLYAVVSILWFVFAGVLARLAFTAGLGLAFLFALSVIGTVVFSWRYGVLFLEALRGWLSGGGVVRLAYANRHPHD